MHPNQNFTLRWLRDRYFIKRERCVAAGTVHSNCFHSAFLCGFACFQFTLSVINISFTIVLIEFRYLCETANATRNSVLSTALLGLCVR
jgi:hypothetical protein